MIDRVCRQRHAVNCFRLDALGKMMNLWYIEARCADRIEHGFVLKRTVCS